ncbi:hypothetical protein HZF05_21150 [Sphingomonas sp. CGMCC 1.13654]|uniref:Uncharacterized protein n=1 Tax=Sphingomonas chungangi TaxID=2683589 RepID=A0A838LCX5_9SPHN|nr:hypothetical protein [Sphingomonas chungangi]MBA2936595.1 hypothetical protein [Sphingomonas chungangi]MVW55980.1 hypothetical protein [Sphingomonas chungangi]
MILFATALLAADALPFAPPIDKPLVYRQTEDRIAPDGSAAHFTLTEEVRFTRDGTGYILTVRALSAEAQAPDAAAASFRAGMKPFIGIPVATRLSAAGEPGEVIDADATWQRVVQSIEQAAATASPPRNGIGPMLAGFRAMPAPAREAMLKGPAIALLGLSLPPLPEGGSGPLAETMDTPLGIPIACSGTVRRDTDRDGAIRYSADLSSDPDAARRIAAQTRTTGAPADAIAVQSLHEHRETSLSASSGLLLSSVSKFARIDPAAPGGERPVSQRGLMLVSQ